MRPFHELKTTLNNLKEALDNSEKINLAFFATKLTKQADLHPEDATIGQIAQVINKINHSSNQLFISRAEIKDLYKRLYSRNTKFAQVFADELGEVQPLATPTLHIREEEKPELNLYEGADQVLLASLKNAMGTTSHAIPTQLAKNAEKLVELECSFPKMVPEVKTVGGNVDCVICSATYATPKGSAIFYVPVEVLDKKATIPSNFVGKTGTKDISRNNIEQYLEDFFIVKGSYGNTEVKAIVEELAVETPKDPELQNIAWQFDSPSGLAAFQFGPKAEAARQWISRKLYSLGKNSHQVSILTSDDKGITFGVKCDRLAFKVPTKVDADKFYEPSIILCQGSIEAFSMEGLNNLELKTADHSIAAAVSSLSELKPSDLVNTVEQALGEENYAKAEDALNVLAHSGDDRAYRTALELYNYGLGMNKTAATKTQCTRMVKNSTSNQVLCGHLNLPLNKTYIDKQGNCAPLHRKAMDQSYEGVSFMNSKVII